MVVPLLLGAQCEDCPGPGGSDAGACAAPDQPPATATIFSEPCFHGDSIFVDDSTELPTSWAGRVGSVAVGPGTRAYLCPPNAWCTTSDTSKAGSTDGVMRVRVELALWGVADLHAHPATHYGFGADSSGDGGMFWGKPGLGAASVNLGADLPLCATDKHDGFDGDAVRHGTRVAVIGQTDQIGGIPHGADGFPSFTGWPHARSVLHQQMHVSWLRRAYEGGLRLMVATAVDNQTLAMLWHRQYGKDPPSVDSTFDFESAKRQLAFITNLAAANSQWMAIARTPAEARQIIAGNRLALVLGVEMDTLTQAQILDLQRTHGVRLVTPIHLADNTFGGAALYEDSFNTNNFFLNGRFFDLAPDPLLTYRPSSQQIFLRYVSNDLTSGGDLVKWGAMEPTPMPIVLPPCPTTPCGYRNSLGLRSSTRIENLMRAGLLIDLAHMSDLAMTQTIELAERHGYPVLNTHSGIRNDDNRARDERSMRASLATRMARLGGMLGLGPGDVGGSTQPIYDWFESYIGALVTTRSRVALGTDLNGLALQMARPEIPITYPFDVAPGLDFRPDAPPPTRLGPLLVGAKTYDFARDGLAHVGLLPEFLEAARRYAATLGLPGAMEPLYRSAHAFVDMWDRAIEASASM
jgi:microsomal dipeptidase-like Zn-dependent dipeptidase